MELTALPSLYSGIQFRSRMEARWAVFMDAIGVHWLYEPEGYDLDGLRYLPDFYLPTVDAFLEVKNPLAVDRDAKKCHSLAMATGKSVYLTTNPPQLIDDSDPLGDMVRIFPDGAEDYGYSWCECPHCHRYGIEFNGRADRIPCKCPKSAHGDKGYNSDTPRLLEAYAKARSYRFEPGEGGYGG
jgi:hypothetical protein